MKGDIHFIDCGEVIWITKKDWETLKKWFKSNPGGQELEEYGKRPTILAAVRIYSTSTKVKKRVK